MTETTQRSLGRRIRDAASYLFPRFDEPTAPEMYRFTGKVRVIAFAVLLIMESQGGEVVSELGANHAWWIFYLKLHVPFIIADGILGLVLWRAPLSPRAMRAVNWISISIEAAAGTILMSAIGSVTSYIVVLHLALLMLYRVSFDFRTGLFTLAVLLIPQWALVLAEVGGKLEPMWLLASAVGEDAPPYGQPRLQIHYMLAISLTFLLLFWGANLTVARLRHSRRAIKLLQNTLAAMYEGQVGQFSGTTLAGTYAVERLIGRGGTGEVYQGHHTRTLRRVAIKILYPHLADDDTQLARFQREAEIAGKLGSDHIVQVLDVDAWHGQPYLVMELLEGETLDDRIARDRALPLAFVGQVVAQVASALDRAHAAGVVHRDLKPQNIFLVATDDGAGEPLAKILDFGASKIHSAATALTHEVGILGTPTFMSPEQTRASGEVDQATDVFALGAITYNMLTGVRPFHAATIPAVLSQINHNEPPPIDRFRDDLPPGLADVVAIAMAKRADQRYASVADVSRDFAAALAGSLPDQVRRRAADLDRGAPAPSADAADPIAPPGETLTAVD